MMTHARCGFRKCPSSLVTLVFHYLKHIKTLTLSYRVFHAKLDLRERCHFASNKAGYPANTSRGQVGRGGNARIPLFDPADRWTNGPTDRRTKALIELCVYN